MRLLSVFLAAACSGVPLDSAAPGPAPTPIVADPAPTGWETRFHRAEPWTPSETELAVLYSSCPRIRTVLVERTSPSFLKVEVQGDRLDALLRVGAILPDGKLANAVHKVRADGAIAFPVACERCTVIFGVKLERGAAACLGRGFSLEVEGEAAR